MKIALARLTGLSLAFSLYCSLAFSQGNLVSEGLYHHYSKKPGHDSFEVNRLWFKDSAIIYELKADIELGENDSVTYRGYDVFRYRYFDIPTNTYYEYNTFTDTAAIVCKYLWEQGFVAGFFSVKSKPASKDFLHLKDTIVSKEKLKRIKYVERKPEVNFLTEVIYYFACDGNMTDLWGLNSSFGLIFPKCTLRQREVITYETQNVFHGIDRYEIIRPFLDSNEDNIFSKWGKNAKDNDVTMSTIADMLKMPISPIKFRNNPKYPYYN